MVFTHIHTYSQPPFHSAKSVVLFGRPSWQESSQIALLLIEHLGYKIMVCGDG